jgi:hypothetical protein
MGCQGPSEERACIPDGPVALRLDLFWTVAKSKSRHRLYADLQQMTCPRWEANHGDHQRLGDSKSALICSTACLVEAPSLLSEPHKITFWHRA